MAKKLDPMAEYALPGKSNEEIDAAHEAQLKARAESGYPRVEVTRDAADRKLFDERAALADLEDIDPYISTDPLKEAVERHKKPGMAYHFLSDRVCDALGTRGYQVVKDERGDVVKVGTLKLAEIPERIAQARAKHYQNEDLSNLREMKDTYTDQVERLKREAHGMGLEVIQPSQKLPIRGSDTGGGLVIER